MKESLRKFFIPIKASIISIGIISSIGITSAATDSFYHNIIRQALNNQTTISLGNSNYDFSQHPQPSPALPDMQDNASVTSSAAAYASQCIFAHSSGSGYGENLYVGTAPNRTVGHAVNAWATEAEDYTYDNMSCTPGKMCGHYTQVVWHNTREVGCAVQECSSVSNGSGGTLFGGVPATLIVCQYSNPGNYVGQHPYEVSTGGNTEGNSEGNTNTNTSTQNTADRKSPGSPPAQHVVTMCSIEKNSCNHMFPTDGIEGYTEYKNCYLHENKNGYECSTLWAIKQGFVTPQEFQQYSLKYSILPQNNEIEFSPNITKRELATFSSKASKNKITDDIISGYEDNQYYSEKEVTLSEVYKVLALNFEIIQQKKAEENTQDNAPWYQVYYNELININVIPTTLKNQSPQNNISKENLDLFIQKILSK